MKSIRKVRTRLKLSMNDVAKHVGVSVQTIFNYETGRCCPVPIRFKKIKEILKLSDEAKYSDYFVEKKTGKYDEGDICSFGECERPPVCRGMCMSHYVVWWRKQKRTKEAEERQAKIEKDNKQRRVRCTICKDLFKKEETEFVDRKRMCKACAEPKKKLRALTKSNYKFIPPKNTKAKQSTTKTHTHPHNFQKT